MNKKIYNLAIRKRGECLLNKIKKYTITIYIYITNMSHLLKEMLYFKYDNNIQKRRFINKSVIAK